jgi:hypothetical protein
MTDSELYCGFVKAAQDQLDKENEWFCLLRVTDGILWRNAAWISFQGAKLRRSEWTTARNFWHHQDLRLVEDAISNCLKTGRDQLITARTKLDGHNLTTLQLGTAKVTCGYHCPKACGFVVICLSHVAQPLAA